MRLERVDDLFGLRPQVHLRGLGPQPPVPAVEHVARQPFEPRTAGTPLALRKAAYLRPVGPRQPPRGLLEVPGELLAQLLQPLPARAGEPSHEIEAVRGVLLRLQPRTQPAGQLVDPLPRALMDPVPAGRLDPAVVGPLDTLGRLVDLVRGRLGKIRPHPGLVGRYQPRRPAGRRVEGVLRRHPGTVRRRREFELVVQAAHQDAEPLREFRWCDVAALQLLQVRLPPLVEPGLHPLPPRRTAPPGPRLPPHQPVREPVHRQAVPDTVQPGRQLLPDPVHAGECRGAPFGFPVNTARPALVHRRPVGVRHRAHQLVRHAQPPRPPLRAGVLRLADHSPRHLVQGQIVAAAGETVRELLDQLLLVGDSAAAGHRPPFGLTPPVRAAPAHRGPITIGHRPDEFLGHKLPCPGLRIRPPPARHTMHVLAPHVLHLDGIEGVISLPLLPELLVLPRQPALERAGGLLVRRLEPVDAHLIARREHIRPVTRPGRRRLLTARHIVRGLVVEGLRTFCVALLDTAVFSMNAPAASGLALGRVICIKDGIAALEGKTGIPRVGGSGVRRGPGIARLSALGLRGTHRRPEGRSGHPSCSPRGRGSPGRPGWRLLLNRGAWLRRGLPLFCGPLRRRRRFGSGPRRRAGDGGLLRVRARCGVPALDTSRASGRLRSGAALGGRPGCRRRLTSRSLDDRLPLRRLGTEGRLPTRGLRLMRRLRGGRLAAPNPTGLLDHDPARRGGPGVRSAQRLLGGRILDAGPAGTGTGFRPVTEDMSGRQCSVFGLGHRTNHRVLPRRPGYVPRTLRALDMPGRPNTLTTRRHNGLRARSRPHRNRPTTGLRPRTRSRPMPPAPRR
ncbi:hypothetical protein OG991_54515 [Streptomyces mirabilis]|nr:hypothetical protein [Streptomyces mirabilis]